MSTREIHRSSASAISVGRFVKNVKLAFIKLQKKDANNAIHSYCENAVYDSRTKGRTREKEGKMRRRTNRTVKLL